MTLSFTATTKRRLAWLQAILALLTLALHPASQACTTLSLRTDSGTVVNIMNMEFPDNLGYTLNHIPSGVAIQGGDFKGLQQTSWQAKHQVIGTGGESDPQAMGAGLNDKGLYVTTLYLEERTRYQAITKADNNNFIAPPLLPTYLLTQFETVDEVKQALQAIKVAGVPNAGFYNVVPTFHWMVTDRHYQSLVIEYTDGELKMHDNPYHAMTNAPTFDFHLNNMRGYPHLNNQGIAPKGAASKATGVGWGTLGMPGDYSPTGRFVRAAFLANNFSGTDSNIMPQAVELSNALIYPPGAAVYRSAFSQKEVTQKTMYAFIANASTGEILFRRYGDLSWQRHSFKDFSGNKDISRIKVFEGWNEQ